MSSDNYGSRRFLMTMGCGVVTTILLWYGKISGGEYVALITLTVVPYIGFSTQEKIKASQNDTTN